MASTQSISKKIDHIQAIAFNKYRPRVSRKNFIFSPWTVESANGLVAEGASGQTQVALLMYMGFNSIDDLNNYFTQKISVLANRIASGGPLVLFTARCWVDRAIPVNPSFTQVVRNIFQGSVEQVDYQTQNIKNVVNQWAHRDVLAPSTIVGPKALIFANSLTIRGSWNQKFDASTTANTFNLLDGNSVNAQFMTSNTNQYISQYTLFKALKLPFRQTADTDFSILIYLPNDLHGYAILMEQIGKHEHTFIQNHLPDQPVEVGNFLVPVLRLNDKLNQPRDLVAENVEPPYDFTGIVNSSDIGKNYDRSRVYYDGSLEIDTGGATVNGVCVALVRDKNSSAEALASEAAGSPAAGGTRSSTSSTSDKVDFVADHPFILFVRENKSGLVVFNCGVTNPTLN